MDIRQRDTHSQGADRGSVSRDSQSTAVGEISDRTADHGSDYTPDSRSDHKRTLSERPYASSFSRFSRIVRPRLFLALAACWLLVIHVFERVRFKNAMDACQWRKWENWSGEQASVEPHRVAFIADPQLVDDHTYPKLPAVLNYLIRRMSDNYHHTNYRYLQQILDPHTTIFIGDLFDGGRDWEDAPWLEEYRRFCRIFPENAHRQSIRGLPGNHDIGFQTVKPAIKERFAAYFGDANLAYVLGNHTFVQMDTISLMHDDPEVNMAPREFLEHCKASLDPSLPRIFLTHVPLYRDPNVELCAAGRESKKPFPLMRGIEYQTVIDYPFSEDILKNLAPILVFSGDDHDYCDTTHVDYADNTRLLAREISCKTNSMTNGIKHPAFQLLSLNNPQNGNHDRTYETIMCYLPSPYLGVKVYYAILAVSVAFLYVWIHLPHKITGLSRGFLNPATGLSAGEKRVSFYGHSGALLAFVVFVLSCYNPM